jgi:hypothetical protein
MPVHQDVNNFYQLLITGKLKKLHNSQVLKPDKILFLSGTVLLNTITNHIR